MIDFSIMKTKRNDVTSTIQPNMTKYVGESLFFQIRNICVSHGAPLYKDAREELIIQCKIA